MLKALFLGMLEASRSYYGDSIGLAPIILSTSNLQGTKPNQEFWIKECQAHPTRIACLNYES